MSDAVKQDANLNATTLRIAVIAALAGLLFGMDIAYVNGSRDLIVQTFSLTVEQSEYMASVLLFGAAAGALFSGSMSRKWGRRTVLLIAAGVFSIFTFMGVFAPDYTTLLVSRFIVGLAVGIASFIAPLYLSEMSPKNYRGALVAMYQLMITVGIFLMFLSNSALRATGSWRLMLAVIAIPSVIMFIGCLTLPRSPRWLVLVGRTHEAEGILSRIRSTQHEAENEFHEITAATSTHTSGFKLLRHGFFIKVVLLGMCLQFFQQFVGMNAFMYYSTDIFKMAGFANPAVSTVVIGLVNMLTTILAIKYVDHFGRKPILYLGLVLMLAACAVVGSIFTAYYSVPAPGSSIHTAMALPMVLEWTTLLFCLVFIFGFAIALGPVIWIICSEIQPLEGRDFGITASTMTNWICNAILANYALGWMQVQPGGTFFFFGSICVLAIICIRFLVPETKGTSLEQIETNLKAGRPLRHLGQQQ